MEDDIDYYAGELEDALIDKKKMLCSNPLFN
jgi:hypothetical protein